VAMGLLARHCELHFTFVCTNLLIWAGPGRAQNRWRETIWGRGEWSRFFNCRCANQPHQARQQRLMWVRRPEVVSSLLTANLGSAIKSGRERG
jgi:hypothetical protein